MFLYLLNLIYSAYSRLKGSKRLFIYSSINKDLGELSVSSTDGYSFTINCHEVKYKLIFANKFFPSKKTIVYSVSSTVSAQASDTLKDILSKCILIPALTPEFVKWDIAKKYIIEAYLDVVIAYLKKDIPPDILRSMIIDTSTFKD